MPVDRGEVAAADARESRANADPVLAGQLRLVDVGEGERPDRRAASGGEAPGDGRGRVLRHLALEQQRLHRTTTCGGAMGTSFRGPPGAFSKCSTSQPRLRAMAASRVSGLTATGNPTASSIGRSDAESA